jgi:hypothetical protein
MDTFIEQIIKKNYGAKDYLIIAAAILGALALVFASQMFLPSMTAIVFVFVCIGAYYLITSLNLEFEYSVTNGDITIDKIISRRSRKRVISMDAHDIEIMGKYKSKEHDQKTYDVRLDASDNTGSEDTWYFSGHHAQKGNVLVIFSPNEKTLTAIKPFLSRQVAIDAFGRN